MQKSEVKQNRTCSQLTKLSIFCIERLENATSDRFVDFYSHCIQRIMYTKCSCKWSRKVNPSETYDKR